MRERRSHLGVTYMEAIEFFESLRPRLIGHTVSFRRLAANSLLIYIDCEPGDQQGVTIWFEPTWHFCGPEGVLVGSRQAQVADAPDADEVFARVAEPLDLLLGRAIESATIEQRTHDLSLALEGDYYIKTFVSDPTDDETWHIRDNETGKRLRGFSKGLAIDLPRGE